MSEDTLDNQRHVSDQLAKLDQLHKRATSVLFKCKTVFPFDPFPDTLIIDYNKVDIIYKHFFGTDQTVSIPISRLSYVGVDSAIFLSSLKLEVRGMEQNPRPLVCMKVKDAHMAKNILFGLMSAEKHNIDLSHLPKEHILEKLIEIGRSI